MTPTDIPILHEQTAMDRYVAQFSTRDEMAVAYASLMAERGTDQTRGWLTLNLAIIDRWSQSGLEYIKKKAWDLAQTVPE